MTERSIRDLLSFADAERVAAIRLAGELAEIAGLAHDAGLVAVAERLAIEARRAAAKVELLDRLLPQCGHSIDDGEDTAPIVVPRTGEHPCRS